MSVQISRFVLLSAAIVILGCQASRPGRDGDTGNVRQSGTPTGAVQPGRVDPKVVAAVQKARLIFDGTLLQPDSAAYRFGGVSVRVQQVFRQPDVLDSLAGKTVIVAPPSHSPLKPGDRAVFFAYGLSAAGATPVVREVYRVDARSDSDVAQVRPLIAAADSVLIDSTIWKASNQSDVVAMVHIDSIDSVYVPDSIAVLGSEHAPAWKSAVGRVVVSFRGADSALLNHPFTTLFAADESPFSDYPLQLHSNETRILMMSQMSRVPAALRPGIVTSGRYFILGPQHVRPSTDSARVVRVLTPAKAGRGSPPDGGVR